MGLIEYEIQYSFEFDSTPDFLSMSRSMGKLEIYSSFDFLLSPCIMNLKKKQMHDDYDTVVSSVFFHPFFFFIAFVNEIDGRVMNNN